MLVARRRERLEALAAEIGGKRARHRRRPLRAGRGRPAGGRGRGGSACTVDTLINNAGFGLVGRFAQLPLERQREMIDLNVRTLTELTHLVLPAMLERRRGAILNVASTAAFQPGPGIRRLFRDQGLCPLLHRGASPGAEGHRRQGFRALSRARPPPSSARSPASRPPASTASPPTRRAWCAPASPVSTATRRWSSQA